MPAPPLAEPSTNCRTILIWQARKDDRSFGAGRLEFYRASAPRGKPNPVIIIVPGGGYKAVAPSEGFPIVEHFLNFGYHAAVLFYRTPGRFPRPVADLQRAIRLLRKNRLSFDIDPHRIGVIAFSAGGHLAGLVGLCPRLHADPDDDLVRCTDPRPDRLALIYPVVRTSPPTHEESAKIFVGDGDTSSGHQSFDLEDHVTLDAPPLFVAHAEDDLVAPCSAVDSFVSKAQCHGMDIEYKRLRQGGHGFGLRSVAGSDWPDPVISFFCAL